MANDLVVSSEALVPSFLKANDARGTEHITKDDLQMPRIGLAQPLSPQMVESSSKYIAGLKQGEMFNSLTGQNYGKGPIYFTVVRADRPRGVEFFPLEEGGGIKDLNVPLNDPRLMFGPRGEKPTAVKFYDFIALRVDPATEAFEPVALSLKGSAVSVAKALNSLMKFRGGPSFAGLYELTSRMETSKKGFTYAVYIVKNAGVTLKGGLPGWVNETLYEQAQAFYESMRDRQVVIDREESEDAEVLSETKEY